MKKKARKVLSVMLTLAMLLGLMPGTSVVANADGVEYLIPAGGTTEVDLSGKDTGYSFNIYDSGGPDGNYGNREDGKLIFTLPPGKGLLLTGSVNTESCDYLNLVDGSGNVLQTTSGTDTIDWQLMTNPGGLSFHSDYSVTYSGFALTGEICDITGTVSFDAGDGTGTMNDYLVFSDSEYRITLPACEFTKERAAFDGWLSSEDGQIYQEGEEVTVDAGTCFTAQWRDIDINRGDVWYIGDEVDAGCYIFAVDSSYNLSSLKRMILPEASYKGYYEEENEHVYYFSSLPTHYDWNLYLRSPEYITPIGIRITGGSGTEEDPFTLELIDKEPASVDTAPVANILTYNGGSQALVEVGAAEGGTMQYSLDGAAFSEDIPEGTMVGEYTVYYKAVGDEEHCDSLIESLTVNIAPKNLTVTAKASGKTYGDADPELEYSVEGLCEGDSITCELVREEGEAVGAYIINYKNLDADDNYKIKFNAGIFTINKKDTSAAAPTANTLTYNGKEQPLIAPVTPPDGGKMVYSLDGRSFGEEIPQGTDAGEYTVYYRVEGDENHEDSEEGQLSVTISPKDLTITAKATGKAYGDADPELEYEQNGLVSGDSITGNLVRGEGETVGSYAISQGTLTAGDNYNIRYTGAVFTIGKKSIRITADSVSKTYRPRAYLYGRRAGGRRQPHRRAGKSPGRGFRNLCHQSGNFGWRQL